MDICLSNFFKKAIKKMWLVGLCVLIGLMITFFIDRSQIPAYTSSAILVSLDTDQTILLIKSPTVGDLNLSQNIVKDYQDIACSQKVALKVARSLSLRPGYQLEPSEIQSMIRVNKAINSNIMTLSATSHQPELSIAVCNAVANAFVNEIRELTGTSYINILDEAKTASVSTRTGGSSLMLLGFFAGVLLGVLLVYLLVLLDQKIHSTEDILLNCEVDIMVVPEYTIK